MSGRRIYPGSLLLMVTALGAPYAMREAMYYCAMRTGVERCSMLTALRKVVLMRGTGAVTTAGSWQGNGRQEVLDALRALPARQRDAVVLRYWGELGIDEVATTMGVSRNSVKTHLQRGLAALVESTRWPTARWTSWSRRSPCATRTTRTSSGT